MNFYIINYESSRKTKAITMAEDQSYEQMPYFMCSIEDICTQRMLESPIFTFLDMKFRLIFEKDTYKGLYVIRIVPDAEDQQSNVPQYPFKRMNPYSILEDFYVTFKKTIRSNTVGIFSRIVWKLEDAKLLVMQGEIRQTGVPFLFVFGPLDEYQKDIINYLCTWCEQHCVQRLVKNSDKLRYSTYSTAVPKRRKDETKVHEVSLYSRSGKLSMFRNIMSEKDLFEFMTSYVLEHSSNFADLPKDDNSSDSLLAQLHRAAFEHCMASLEVKIFSNLADIPGTPRSPEAELLLARRKLRLNRRIRMAKNCYDDAFRRVFSLVNGIFI